MCVEIKKMMKDYNIVYCTIFPQYKYFGTNCIGIFIGLCTRNILLLGDRVNVLGGGRGGGGELWRPLLVNPPSSEHSSPSVYYIYS